MKIPKGHGESGPGEFSHLSTWQMFGTWVLWLQDSSVENLVILNLGE